MIFIPPRIRSLIAARRRKAYPCMEHTFRSTKETSNISSSNELTSHFLWQITFDVLRVKELMLHEEAERVSWISTPTPALPKKRSPSSIHYTGIEITTRSSSVSWRWSLIAFVTIPESAVGSFLILYLASNLNGHFCHPGLFDHSLGRRFYLRGR